MSKLRVACYGMSLDGFGAGPDQSLENPMGVGGMALHSWVFPTRFFSRMRGADGGTTGVDDDFAMRGFANVGAWILGRNMFGPVRGPWPDDSWKGWWGDEPPYHCAGLRADPPPAAAARDGRRHDVPFRHRRHRGGARAGRRRRRRQGRAGRRRRGDGAAVPAGGADRRDAPGGLAGAPRPRRAAARRHRPAGARVPGHRARR